MLLSLRSCLLASAYTYFIFAVLTYLILWTYMAPGKDTETLVLDSIMKEMSSNPVLRAAIGDGVRPSVVRQKMVKPIVKDSVFLVYPALRRAIDVAAPERTVYIEATQVPKLIAEITSMHRDGRVLTASSMDHVRDMLEELRQAAPTFEPPRRLAIPDTVRGMADALMKHKNQAALGWTDEYTSTCFYVAGAQLGTGQPGPDPKSARSAAAENAWASDAAKVLVSCCKDAWKVTRNALTRGSAVQTAPAALRETIRRARIGKLFGDNQGPGGPTRLSKEVWIACKTASKLNHTKLWEMVLSPALRSALTAIFKAAFAPAILNQDGMRGVIEAASNFSGEDFERLLVQVGSLTMFMIALISFSLCLCTSYLLFAKLI